MDLLRNTFNLAAASINAVLWHPAVLYILLVVGIFFTIRSGFIQYRSLVHGTALILGKHGKSKGPGAISHFQALSAALSATVGLGNIGGVALGISLGGPGAVFWMWVVGFLGMSIKTVEVTLSMLFRNTDDPENPHGGPMYVADRGLGQMFSPKVGKILAMLFCVTLLVSTFTGGNAFQAWNTGIVTQQSFGIPPIFAGVALSVLVGLVILGGISRIGMVAGRIVPLMCGLYLVAAIYVVVVHIDMVPEIMGLIFKGAFDGLDGQGAFLGGTAGFAFSAGLQRAFFSNEAGQGSSSMAHAAVRTDEPAREGLVAGLEPFIDTLVVCTLTAMVILISGSWNREADFQLKTAPVFIGNESTWTAAHSPLPHNVNTWHDGDAVTIILEFPGTDKKPIHHMGTVQLETKAIHWAPITSETEPVPMDTGIYQSWNGAALTAYSFDRIKPGLGLILVTIATWLFALSTMISWSYYGEQGVVYLFGTKWVTTYKLIFCATIVFSSSGLLRDITEVNNLTMLGTGAMLFVNVPIMLLLHHKSMACQKDYKQRY